MQDLSHLAANSLTVSSMAAGNMVSSNEQAMTAPGSRPVDPLPDRTDQGDPNLGTSGAQVPVSTQKQPGRGFTPTPARWTTGD